MKQHDRGFTLIEVAISMVILGLAVSGLVIALSQQVQQSHLMDTRNLLTQANQALTAFVVANARLPCPALAGSAGSEATVAGAPGQCTATAGFLPAVTLGLPNLDANGLLNDGWADGSSKDDSGAVSYPRAIRYAVAPLFLGTPQRNALTRVSLAGVPRATVGAALDMTPVTGYNGLFVCRSSTGLVASNNRCGAAANSLAINAVAVIWSQGPTGNDVLGNSADETQNAAQLTGGGVPRAFIMHDPSDVGGAAGRFDDLVVWLGWGPVADKLMLAWQVP